MQDPAASKEESHERIKDLEEANDTLTQSIQRLESQLLLETNVKKSLRKELDSIKAKSDTVQERQVIALCGWITMLIIL